MRRLNMTVLDEYLYNLSGNPNGVFTSQEFNQRLGQFDQLAICAVIDNASSAAGGLSVQIEHSADGRNWLSKNGTTNGEINGNSNNYDNTGTKTLWASDPGSTPSLGFVRLRIWFNAASIGAHVKIHVTGRDMGG